MQWRILPVRQLAIRCWDGEWVVNDTISGDTHLLSFGAGVIVDQLRKEPATTAELASILRNSAPRQDENVQEYLDALASLDLIEPCPV